MIKTSLGLPFITPTSTSKTQIFARKLTHNDYNLIFLIIFAVLMTNGVSDNGVVNTATSHQFSISSQLYY